MKAAILVVGLAFGSLALAADEPYFTPLRQSAAVVPPNHVSELTSPWQVPAGVSQRNLTSLREVEEDSAQSTQRVDAGAISSMFDMLAYDPSGRYIFIPHETPYGAGVSRYDTHADKTELLFAGDSAAGNDSSCGLDLCDSWSHDFAAFDPARWTPNGTIWLAEEWAGLGRVVEVLNPLGPAPENPAASALTAGVDYRIVKTIANVAHEGLHFSLKHPNRVIYYVDDWNSGSVYALILKQSGDYAGGGQTFVLSVDAFAATGGDASGGWNQGPNQTATRLGPATWVPITDAEGNPLTGITDPFRDGPFLDPRTHPDLVRGGRAAADDAGGTPYGRPEDMEIGLLDNLNEVLYISTTSEHSVISVEMLGDGKAFVRRFASRSTPTNLGLPGTSGGLNAPDNLAQDALGNIYIVEDSSGSGDEGGDIWFARDANGDGVAESIDHFMSLRVAGAESTGMIFHPTEPTRFVVAVQHPSSTDLGSVPGGFGDAVWEFDLAGVAADLRLLAPASAQTQPPDASDALPLHAQIIAYLQSGQEVRPRPLPHLHPIHTVHNHEAIIPPQCYTRTEGRFNPCYVCHQSVLAGRENSMDDRDLQEAYSFSDPGMTNHWENLFEDRSGKVAEISDQEILEWIGQDNYTPLKGRLEAADFGGWIPDLENLHLAAGAFDEQGFALDGSHWVAFNYKPFPSTFWPTNGSTDDVMIRLPEAFRSNSQGQYSRDTYMANLAILELTIKGLDRISTPPVDETRAGGDLNADGFLGVVEEISRTESYVGAAADAHIEPFMYPEGAEMLHTVRYLGLSAAGEIEPSRRMKEVRYMRKWVAYRKSAYARYYQLEGFEKELGHLPSYRYLGDRGLDNKFGWALQGFIEDTRGELRAATYEENLFCMGCHTSIGSTIDKTFAFPRKVDGARGWGYINLKGMPDAPAMGETEGGIAAYLARVGGGGEFRSNPEMFFRWFNPDGTLNRQKVRNARDVYELIAPSSERALQLNKAYRAIVAEQDFIYGRDAFARPPMNVYRHVDPATAPTLAPGSQYEWDIRLDWSSQQQQSASILQQPSGDSARLIHAGHHLLRGNPAEHVQRADHFSHAP